MTFSATGSILQNDITLVGRSRDDEPEFDVPILIENGYTPLLSTITGSVRALCGIIHAIVHLAATIFDYNNATYHIHQVGIGLLHILRGLVEVVPLVGNLTVFAIDIIRVHIKFKNEFIEQYPEYKENWTRARIADALLRGNDRDRGLLLAHRHVPEPQLDILASKPVFPKATIEEIA